MTLKEYLRANNMVAADLADIIGAEARTVQAWIDEVHAPRNERLKRALTELGITFNSRPRKVYAFYKGDECLFVGTVKEFAEFRCVAYVTARNAVNPSTHKRAAMRKGGKQILGYLLEEEC